MHLTSKISNFARKSLKKHDKKYNFLKNDEILSNLIDLLWELLFGGGA